MPTKVKIETENIEICEVKTVRSDEEANKLFTDGWILLHAGASHIDGMGYNAKTHFMMGKPANNEFNKD